MFNISYLLDSMELLRKFRMRLKPRFYLISPRLHVVTSLKGGYDLLKFIFGSPIKWIYRYRTHTVKQSIFDMLTGSGR